MLFQITDIEFDFDDYDDEALSVDEAYEIVCEVYGQIWEADDGDDLIEEITCASGYCIKSIDYRRVLN